MHHRFLRTGEPAGLLEPESTLAERLADPGSRYKLAYESNKARVIIRSRDISFAYTNIMANDYYSVKDYDYFCFWCHVSESEKKKDVITGFVFFTFKGKFGLRVHTFCMI
jgi:hypothetical protein